MGKPVRIDDMVRNLIKLSGYKPDEDIKIVYTGLRPGEKLFEEFMKKLTELEAAARKNSMDIKRMIADIVGNYKINF